MPKYLRSLLILGIVMLGTQVLAVPPQPPQFVDSTYSTIRGAYCDEFTFTFQAAVVDPPPGSDNPIRYHLISGPGELDGKTGEWVWHPSYDGFTGYYKKVVVAASIGGNEATMTTGDDNFTLHIYVTNQEPQLYLGDHPENSRFTLTEPGLHTFDLNFIDPDSCNIPVASGIKLRTVYPTPYGSIKIEGEKLLIDLAPEDIGRKFYIEIIGEVDNDTFLAWFGIDTRAEVNVAFTSCPQVIDIKMCDTLKYQIKATDFTPDSSYNYFYFYSGISYKLVSGPGYLSSAGEYRYEPTIDEGGMTYDVIITATYTTDLITAVDTCRFDLNVEGFNTEIKLKDHLCGDTVKFDEQPLSWGVGIEGRYFGECDLHPVTYTTDTDIAGTVVYDSSYALGSYYWFYYPAREDGGKTIGLTFKMVDPMGDTISCALYLQNNWTPGEDEHFQVRVGYVDEVELGSSVEIPVYLDEATTDIGGFDFLLEFDKRILIFNEASLGDQFGENGCGWEYFNYRTDTTVYDPYYQVIKVVGIPDINNGDIHPSCMTPSNLPTTLFNLSFDVTTQYDRECRPAVVRFRWADCADNTLTTPDGHILFASDKIYFRDVNNPDSLIDYTNPNVGYPTITGFQPMECPSEFSAQKAITFINGGIHTYCSDTNGTFLTGDVNLNGIAFELADLYVFRNYFIYDTAIFNVSVERSSKTTDINGDGKLLTVADWQYMAQNLIGSSLDPGENLVDTLDAVYRLNNAVLSFDSDLEYGAIQVILEGDNHPTLLQTQMIMQSFFDTTYNITRIFIYSFSNRSFGMGDLIGNISGDLRYLEAADLEGRIIRTSFSPIESDNFRVRIARVDQALQGEVVSVPVYLDSASGGLGGFDLLFEYDSRVLTFAIAEPGALFDSDNGCGWEYFTYRFGIPLEDSIFNAIKVVAVAETNNGDVHPSCFLPDELPGELFHINFTVTNDRTYECAFAPIRFIWNDCSDNALTNPDGQDFLVSNKVYTPSSNNLQLIDITDPNSGFPTMTGYQTGTCSTSVTNAQQMVDFVNGGVTVVCANGIDHRGDVNYNAISYEIADLVLFEKYFTRGVGEFIVDVNKQIEATDVNGNGTPLEVADWQYLLRIVIGDATPGYDFMFDTLNAEINYSSETKTLRAFTDMDYGAMYIVIRGNYTPLSYLSEMEYDYLYDDSLDLTRIFIYSTDGDSFGAGDILGNIQGEILDLQVADYEGHVVIPAMNIVMGVNDNLDLLPNEFGLAQNYPNPFNNSTVISFSLPNAQEVEFEIVNILGKKVYSETRRYEAGIHQIYWEGNVASGIYYYRIKAGDKIAIRKMMLLK